MKFDLVILGSGESGMGAAFLASAKGHYALLSDQGTLSDEKKKTLRELGVSYEEGGHSDAVLKTNLVVKSPGIPDTAGIVQRALGSGIEVISELEYGYRHLPAGTRIIAITGTNGKTTTSLLTYHLLRTAGLDVALAGNVGYSFARRVAERDYAFYVIEVSSFQLDNIVSFSPDIAVLLNITPDHLDRYEYQFDKYVASKFRITDNLTQQQTLIYCADSLPVAQVIAKRKIEACLFAVSATQKVDRGAYLDNEHLIFRFDIRETGDHARIPLGDIRLIGKHNMVNTMSAVLAALTFDVPMDRIIRGLRTFENAPHRLELIRDVDGVQYINDSKATNVDAVFYALEGIDAPIIWIAGGIDKGNDYSMIETLVKRKVKGIVCLGTDNTKLVEAFGSRVQLFGECQDMGEAIRMAGQWSDAGDVVLLSPACASFDLFDNYEHRGDEFRRIVNELTDQKMTRA